MVLVNTSMKWYYFLFLLFSYLPDSRAQHCNHATLLAGRCGNNLWCSVIFPMGPSLFLMLVFSVRDICFLCQRCVYFSGFYLATCSVLYLSCSLPGGPTCISWKYFAMVLVCVLCCGRLVLLLLTWGVSTVSKNLCCSIYPLHCLSINALRSKRRLDRRWVSSTIRIGCFSSQSWIVREYAFVIWWTISISVGQK